MPPSLGRLPLKLRLPGRPQIRLRGMSFAAEGLGADMGLVPVLLAPETAPKEERRLQIALCTVAHLQE